MLEPSVETAPPVRSRNADRPRRIAVALQDPGERDAFFAALADAGLALNAGAVALHRIDELLADPPDALVVVGGVRHPHTLTAVRRAHHLAPMTRVVVVAPEATAVEVRQALNAGADAYVLRRAVAHALPAAVHAVVAGLVCVPRDVRRLLAKPTFSHREKQVLGLVVTGLTNREIAGRLYLAESTVKSHLMSAFAKLGVRSRKDATALLLDPAEGLAEISLVGSAGDAAYALRHGPSE
jgi:DNA-binding NarL/FixJ family response regulator